MDMWEQAYRHKKKARQSSTGLNPTRTGGNGRPPADHTGSRSYEDRFRRRSAGAPPEWPPEFSARPSPAEDEARTQSAPIPAPQPPARLERCHRYLADIWANMLQETRHNLTSILFSGVAHGAGTSFIAVHFALFLALEYRLKVLLVDTSPRGPASTRTRTYPGLWAFLRNDAPLDRLVLPTEYPDFFLLPSGLQTHPTHPTDLVTRASASALLHHCRQHFQVTILDGQPLLACPGMLEFAGAVDMAALVCRYGCSRRDPSRQALDRLRQTGVRALGVILNDRQFPVPAALARWR